MYKANKKTIWTKTKTYSNLNKIKILFCFQIKTNFNSNYNSITASLRRKKFLLAYGDGWRVSILAKYNTSTALIQNRSFIVNIYPKNEELFSISK